MQSNLTKLRDIVSRNIKDMRILADKLISTMETVGNLEETLSRVHQKIDLIEKNRVHASPGVKVFSISQDSLSENATVNQLSLDSNPDELRDLISQHPNWLRPFAINAELHRRNDTEDRIKIIRSSSGYMRVIRLLNGSEWSYIEPMRSERFNRIPMLKKIFETPETVLSQESTIFVVTPLKIQPLQKSVLWEIICNGKVELDQS
jgi:hypothetical protein